MQKYQMVALIKGLYQVEEFKAAIEDQLKQVWQKYQDMFK
jgi:hypothetical protein